VVGEPSNAGSQVGRFLYVPEWNWVFYEFIIQFAISGQVPGVGNYCVSLPRPARYEMGGNAAVSTFTAGTGAVQKILGMGHCTDSFLSEIPNVPLLIVLSPFGSNSHGGRSQDWVNFYCPYIRQSGSSTIATGGHKTKAVAFTDVLPNGILALDINVNLTTNPTSSQVIPAPFWISPVSATSFTINVPVNVTTNALGFDWKLITDSVNYVSDQSPFVFGGGSSLKGFLSYECE
jgi:hypothetical protein